uniref:Uncharacterized protein n=1 Tax=Ixodes ricinus TaxID=34613 RepID=A0A090XDB6_IXORI
MDKLGRARDSKRHGTIVGPIRTRIRRPGLLVSSRGLRPGVGVNGLRFSPWFDDDDGGRVSEALAGKPSRRSPVDTWNIGDARLRWSGLC